MRSNFLLGVMLCLGLTSSTAGAIAVDPSAYAGSERCRECHAEKHRGWLQTPHASVIQDARANPSAVKGDFRVPDLGFTLGDAEYTIGSRKDQRYMKRIGDDYYVLPKRWSVEARTWLPNNVWSWKKMPYGKFCRGCHVTAYDPEKKTVVEDRVGCEACHGPGKEHAASEGKKPIVNPRRLPEDRRQMICAACHVRGSDPTGAYAFPVGFSPGDDLGLRYVPVGKAEGETNSQAILRGFVKWKKEREEGQQSKCDVCTIPGVGEPKKSAVDDANSFCFGCHDIKAKYPQHSHHPPSVPMLCFDCHVQESADRATAEREDIHSYGYFLVHTERCYDRDIGKACVKCHKDKDLDWSRNTVDMWRKPSRLDH